jgi:hypothetical protein
MKKAMPVVDKAEDLSAVLVSEGCKAESGVRRRSLGYMLAFLLAGFLRVSFAIVYQK